MLDCRPQGVLMNRSRLNRFLDGLKCLSLPDLKGVALLPEAVTCEFQWSSLSETKQMFPRRLLCGESIPH